MRSEMSASNDVPRRMLVFASYRLDVNDERLFRDREAVALKPKALKVLLRLLAARGRLVTKRELLRDVWSDVTVGESVLKVCISELRAALRDDPDSPLFVQTVHGRGYRFIAPIEELAVLTSESPRFVGRHSERDTLSAALQRATTTSGQLLLITGEPGIGKTALLEAFVRRVERGQDAWLAYRSLYGTRRRARAVHASAGSVRSAG